MRALVKGLAMMVLMPGLCLAAHEARPKETVTWIAADYPPGHILRGPFSGQGFDDRNQASFIAHLPQYRHVLIEANFSRIFKQMEASDGICTVGVLKTPEREKVARYSDVYLITWSHLLIMAESRKAQFLRFADRDGRIDLAALAEDHGLETARAAGRAFPPSITAFLDRAGENRQVIEVPETPSMFRMLDSGRIDYIFGYPFEINYYKATLGLRQPLVGMALAGIPPVMFDYVACSDKPLGRRVIADIDALIREAGIPDPYIEAQSGWLDPESIRGLEELWPRFR